MSVIGLTVSLTQRVTRKRSGQAACVITISRGCDGPPRHSPGFSAQNSTQPIGARVVSPRLAYIARPTPARAGALNPARMTTIANPAPCPLKPNIVAPVSCWDHVSHKGFAPPLSTPSTIEANTSKNSGQFDLYLNKIRLEFETTAIDSNCTH